MADRDLFGPVPPNNPVSSKRGPKGGKHYTKPNGYGGQPGTGPDGKRCMDCAHCVRTGSGKNVYPKCLLSKPLWTHGRGSDILARSPACQRFEEPNP